MGLSMLIGSLASAWLSFGLLSMALESGEGLDNPWTYMAGAAVIGALALFKKATEQPKAPRRHN